MRGLDGMRVLAGEEVCHDGRGGLRVYVVGLAGEGGEPSAGQGRRGGPARVAQERRAVLAADDQGLDPDRGRQVGGQRRVADDGRVIGDRTDSVQRELARGLTGHPAADPVTEAATKRIVQIARQYQRATHRVTARHGVSLGDCEVIWHLAHTDSSQHTPGQLAKAFQVTAGTMTSGSTGWSTRDTSTAASTPATA